MAIFAVRHTPVGKTTHRAGTAAAHVRYISRKSAASVVLGEHMPTGSQAAQTWLKNQEDEDRKNARVVDRLMLTFPRELHPLQRVKLLRRYARRMTKGRAAWLAAIHDKGKDAHNPHAHLVIRDRDIKTGKRVFEFSEKGSTTRARQIWQECVNEALERAGRPERVFAHRRKAEALKTPVWASGAILGPSAGVHVGGFAPANP